MNSVIAARASASGVVRSGRVIETVDQVLALRPSRSMVIWQRTRPLYQGLATWARRGRGICFYMHVLRYQGEAEVGLETPETERVEIEAPEPLRLPAPEPETEPVAAPG